MNCGGLHPYFPRIIWTDDPKSGRTTPRLDTGYVIHAKCRAGSQSKVVDRLKQTIVYKPARVLDDCYAAKRAARETERTGTSSEATNEHGSLVATEKMRDLRTAITSVRIYWSICSIQRGLHRWQCVGSHGCDRARCVAHSDKYGDQHYVYR